MKIKTIQIILVFLFVLAVCEFSLAEGFYLPEVRQKLSDIPVNVQLSNTWMGPKPLSLNPY